MTLEREVMDSKVALNTREMLVSDLLVEKDQLLCRVRELESTAADS